MTRDLRQGGALARAVAYASAPATLPLLVRLGMCAAWVAWLLGGLVVGVTAESIRQPARSGQMDGCLFSEPLLLFQDTSEMSNGAGPIGSPFALVDAEGAVHLFWEYKELALDPSGHTLSIYYLQRDAQGSWSAPVDILVSPHESLAMYPQAAVDAQGFVHVVWSGGGKLFYSRAFAREAADPHAWLAPQEIPLEATVHGLAAFKIDSQDILHVVYAERGLDLYHVRSGNKGATWSGPSRISDAGYGQATDTPRLWVGEGDVLNVVWTQLQLPDGYPPTGAFFSRSDDGGESWSQPIEVAGMNDGQASIAEGRDGQLSVVYHGRVGIGGAFHRWSDNGGGSWREPTTLVPRGQGGLTGAPSLDVDSAGNVHMVVSQEYPSVWYGAWDGSRWTSLTDLSALFDEPPQGYVEQPAIAVGLGSQLHVVFYDDGQRLWYTTCSLPAPQLSPAQYELGALATAPPNEALTPSSTVTPVPQLSPAQYEPGVLAPVPQEDADWLIWSLLPSVLLVSAVVFVALIRRGPLR